jgi:hypothetical protein
MAWAGFPLFLQVLTRCYGSRCGGVSNVDIDGNNTLHVKAIGVAISTFETLPSLPLNVLARHCPVNLRQEWLVPGAHLAYNVAPQAGCQSRWEGAEQNE